MLGRSGFPLTDLGNAERLVARHGADLRYVPQWGAMVWDGKRWTLDTTGEFARRAKDTVRAMVAEASALPDHERQALIKHSLASESTRAIAAMQECHAPNARRRIARGGHCAASILCRFNEGN